MIKYLNNIQSFFVLLCMATCMAACTSSAEKAGVTDNSRTKGTLNILADDTFKPILGTSIETFEAIYPETKINVLYTPQEKAFLALQKGEVDVIIAGRSLSENELKVVKQRGLIPKINKIASDGIIFIINKDNSDNNISEKRIREILTKDKLQLICDKSNSGNLIYLKERFNLTTEIGNISAAGSDSAVIEYVASHPGQVGIIGMALISDQEDSKVKARLEKIKPLSVQYTDTSGNTIEVEPTLDALATEKYPFIREIFVINLDGNMNLGTGLANFLVGEKGQRIVLKAGLLPSQLPSREILISNENL